MSANADISPQNFSSVNIKTSSLLQKRKHKALALEEFDSDELESV